MNKIILRIFTLSFLAIMISHQSNAETKVKVFGGTSKRYSTDFPGALIFGGEASLEIEGLDVGIGGYYNDSDANGWVGGTNGNALERQHYVYAYGDYPVVTNLLIGAQAGMIFLQKNYNLSDPTQVTTSFRTTKAFAMSLRLVFNVPVTASVDVGALTQLSFFMQKNDPAAGFSNSIYVAAKF